MSYDTGDETVGSTVTIPSTYSGIEYRALTESQGDSSTWYRPLAERTSGDIRISPGIDSWRPAYNRKQQKGSAHIASREHIARLLRQCGKLARSLKLSEDRTDTAMAGAMLCDMLDDIWRHRHAREDDWIELLNALQIVLRDEIFETMSVSKKDALVILFTNTLVARTISRAEVARGAQLLSDAGFDLWRGLSVESID